jgi:hypothetical protein
VIEKAVGGVGATAVLGADEVAVVGGVAGELEELLGQPGLFGQQSRVVRRLVDLPQGGIRADFSRSAGISKPKSAVCGCQSSDRQCAQPGALDGLGRLQAQRIVEPEAHPVLQILGGAVFTLR